MTQAEKTMLRYQYVMANSTRVQNDFQRTSSSWHNQVVILKQQLQQLATVIGSGLIQAIKPFVMQMNKVLSGLITFAQQIVNALGKIFGWEMEVNTKGLSIDDESLENVEDLSSGLDDAADSATDAAKATKKLNDQLQGFDKLNVLRTTDKTNSSSKSNKNNDNTNGTNTGGVGDTSALASLKKTKSAFESEIDNLFDLGKYIGEKLRDLLADINWDNVYEGARKFGTGLADFLNGLVTTEGLFDEIGKTVAGALNTVLHFLDSFGETFKWKEFGNSLARGLTSFLNNIQWETALSAAKNWGQGIADAIAGFVDEQDFNIIGETIANAIKTWITFWLTLGSGIPWKDIGTKLAETINSAIKNFPAKELAETINVWVQGIYDLVMNAVGHIKWGDLGSKIAEFLDHIDVKTINIILGAILLKAGAKFAVKVASTILSKMAKQILIDFGLFLKDGITLPTLLINITKIAPMLPATPAFDVIASELLEKVWNAVYNGLGKSFQDWYDKFDKFIKEDIIGGFFKTIEKALSFEETKKMWDKSKEDFKKGGIYIIKGIGEGILATLEFLVEPIASVLVSVWNGFCKVFGISSPAEAMKPIGKYIIEGVLEGFKLPDFESAFQWVADKLGELANKVSEVVSGIKTDIETKWETIKTTVGTKISELKTNAETKWIELSTNLVNKLEELKSSIGSKWDTLKTTIDSKIDSIKTSVTNKWSAIKESIGTKMSEIYSSISSKWDTIKETAGTKIDLIKEKVGTKFGDVKDRAVSKMDGLSTNISNIWTSIKNGATNKIPTIKTTVGRKFTDVANAIKTPMNNLKTFFTSIWTNCKTIAGNGVTEVRNAIVRGFNKMITDLKSIPGSLQSLFKFKLPTFHFQTTTLEVANLRITYPSGVYATWNKRAYNNPLMFTSPTIIPSAMGLQGFGDGNGGEIVYGHENLMNDIREASGGGEMTAIGNRQLANDQRIISLLQIIAEKEFGISGDSLFRSVRDQASNYTMRTGKQAFDF